MIFFWGVLLGELILRHSNNLSKTLQPPKLSAAEAQKVVAATLRNGNELSVSDPELPRRRKTPRRHVVGDSEGDVITDEESL